MGNFSWGSECRTGKPRIIAAVYSTFSDKLVSTNTLVKNCIMLAESIPNSGRTKICTAPGLRRGQVDFKQKKITKFTKKYDKRKKNANISGHMVKQFQQDQPLACIVSSLGQCGRAEGYVLESKELEFYLRKIKA